jgi:hypothetical protein
MTAILLYGLSGVWAGVSAFSPYSTASSSCRAESGPSEALAAPQAELLTARRQPRRQLNESARTQLEAITSSMRQPSSHASAHARSPSDSSMLQRLTTLLPGYSRVPPSCPLPLRPHIIDDMSHTELASVTRRDLVAGRDKNGDRFFHDPTETNRGMLYPPEMLQPAVVVWLPHTPGPEAEHEAAELEGLRGLLATVDPPRNKHGTGEKRRRRTSLRKENLGQSFGKTNISYN